MSRKHVSPRRRRDSLYPNPSDHLTHLRRLLRTPRLRVVLYCRVSTLAQNGRGNLDQQVAKLQKLVEQRGVTVIATFQECVSGHKLDAGARSELLAAARCARKHGAALVAESTTRYLRNPDWRLPPTAKQFEQLRLLTGDVVLATWLHPDKDDRSHQTKRGQEAKDRRGGRPPCHLNQELLDAVSQVMRRLPS